MGEKIADRIRLLMFRWSWVDTLNVIVAGSVGTLLGSLWGR